VGKKRYSNASKTGRNAQYGSISHVDPWTTLKTQKSTSTFQKNSQFAACSGPLHHSSNFPRGLRSTDRDCNYLAELTAHPIVGVDGAVEANRSHVHDSEHGRQWSDEHEDSIGQTHGGHHHSCPNCPPSKSSMRMVMKLVCYDEQG
jgi:hypothetical protein